MKDLTKTEQDLFCEALALETLAARRDFLERTCADNAPLRKRIEALLALQPSADRFFANAASLAQGLPPNPLDDFK